MMRSDIASAAVVFEADIAKFGAAANSEGGGQAQSSKVRLCTSSALRLLVTARGDSSAPIRSYLTGRNLQTALNVYDRNAAVYSTPIPARGADISYPAGKLG